MKPIYELILNQGSGFPPPRSTIPRKYRRIGICVFCLGMFNVAAHCREGATGLNVGSKEGSWSTVTPLWQSAFPPRRNSVAFSGPQCSLRPSGLSSMNTAQEPIGLFGGSLSPHPPIHSDGTPQHLAAGRLSCQPA